jgi:hypothetical protein
VADWIRVGGAQGHWKAGANRLLEAIKQHGSEQ